MIDIIDHPGSHGPVRELRLARPPANALDPALIAALRSAVAEGQRGEALVLSGAPGRFSGGLDVPALLQLDRAAIGALWTDFFGLMRDLARSEVPIVAALTGHSPAGGTVLALFTDYRILAQGQYMIGLNEVQVGLPVPQVLVSALAYVVGARQAERLAVGGLLIGPDEALRIGLVDELAPVAEVVPRALAWATTLLGRPRAAMRDTRRLARAPLHAGFDGVDAALVEQVTDRWFADETQQTMRALAAKLGKR